MNVFESILLGLIQGITEFLPVSSSGHLTLFGRIFHTDSAAMLSFSTWLHMGTLVSVVLVMRKELLAIFAIFLASAQSAWSSPLCQLFWRRFCSATGSKAFSRATPWVMNFS